jgi:hypothetical protein
MHSTQSGTQRPGGKLPANGVSESIEAHDVVVNRSLISL